MKKSRMERFIKSLKTMREGATDEQALDAPNVYAEWKTDTEYAVDDRVLYADILYKCLTAHTSQDTWTPDYSPSLWARVHLDIQPWVQPTGATDAYMIGDKVTHLGKTWVSIIDNNIWEPSVYGWDEVI